MAARHPGAAPERLYGSQEAARFLGLHRSTLHLAIRQRLIVPDTYTPGGHARFRRETLEMFRVHLTEGAATSAESVVAPVRVLGELARRAAGPVTFEVLSRAAVAGAREVLPGVEMCSVVVNAQNARDQHALRLIAQEGFPDYAMSDFARPHALFRFAAIAAMRTLTPQVCEDTSHQPIHTGMARLWHEGRPGSYAVLPIVTDQQAPGALVCASRDARRYSAPELAFLHGVADVLAGALDRTSNQQPSPTHLHAASALVWQALALRREEHGASACPEGACAQRTLAHLFQHLNGAANVSTQGFATDIANSDARLGAVIARARAGEEAPRDEWTVDGAPHSAAAVSVPLDDGARAAVGALWTERRLDPEADHALLVAFAGAYLLALRST